MIAKLLEPCVADLPVCRVKSELLAGDDGLQAGVHQHELHLLLVQGRPDLVPVELGGGACRGSAPRVGDGAAEAIHTLGHRGLGGQELVSLALGRRPGRGSRVLAVGTVITILEKEKGEDKFQNALVHLALQMHLPLILSGAVETLPTLLQVTPGT